MLEQSLPFWFGFTPTAAYVGWLLYDILWVNRSAVGPKWEYDHEYQRVIEGVKRISPLRVVGWPIVVGAASMLYFWTLYYAMEMI